MSKLSHYFFLLTDCSKRAYYSALLATDLGALFWGGGGGRTNESGGEGDNRIARSGEGGERYRKGEDREGGVGCEGKMGSKRREKQKTKVRKGRGKGKGKFEAGK